MGDIFDQIQQKPQQDIFDQLAAPQRDVFDQLQVEKKIDLSPTEKFFPKKSIPKKVAQAGVGVLETAAQLATTVYGLPASGVAGLAALPVGGIDAAQKAVEKTSEFLIYEPMTEGGEKVAKVAFYPFEKLHDLAAWSGNTMLEHGASPEIAGLFHTMIEGGTVLLVPKALGKIKGLRRARMGKKYEMAVEESKAFAEQLKQRPPEAKPEAPGKEVAKPKVEPPAGKPVAEQTGGIHPELEFLAEEAKKYKSAEEFKDNIRRISKAEGKLTKAEEKLRSRIVTTSTGKIPALEIYSKEFGDFNKSYKDFYNRATEKIAPPAEPSAKTKEPGWEELGQVELPRFGEIAEGVRAPFQRVYGWLDVEAPFVRGGAHKTGIATKNFYSQQISEQTYALEVVKSKPFQDITPRQSKLAFIKASKPDKVLDMVDAGEASKITAIAKEANKYFDEAGNRAIKDGVLKNRWPEGLSDRLVAEIKGIDEAIVETRASKQSKGMKKSRIKKLETKRRELESALDDFNTINPKYVHIPLNHFMNKIYDEFGRSGGNEIIARGTRFYKGRFFKQRKTIDIEKFFEWIESIKNKKGKPLFTEKDFDIRIAMGNYANQLGKMRGLAKIFKAAYAEKLIVDKKLGWPDGYGEVPLSMQIRFPELKGRYIHNAFADYLMKHMDVVEGSMQLGRVLGYTKMMAFYNPFFLPAYDMWQGTWLGSMRSIKAPIYLKDGIKSVFKRDKHYYENLENGGFSTPYAPPFVNFMKDMKKNRYSSPLKTAMQTFGKTVINPLDSFYKTVWDMAWSGDHMIRMASYHYLKKQGMTPVEAAQISASFHGDYARFSPRLRKVFNKIWFTPTFKYVMAHAQTNMVKSAAKVATNALKMKKSSQRDMIYAKGLIALTAGQLAKDQVMKWWGFEVDEWGLRYTKTVTDDEGMEKELVVYWPDPGNLFMRYVHRWKKWGVESDHLAEAFYKAHWDFHSLWAVGMEIAANRKPNGDLIYNIFDQNEIEIAKDRAWYGITRIVGAVGFIEKRLTKKEDRAAYKKLKEETHIIWSTFLETATLVYLRDPDDVRIARVMRQTQKFFRWNQFVDPDRTYIETYIKKMKALEEELAKIQKEKEKK